MRNERAAVAAALVLLFLTGACRAPERQPPIVIATVPDFALLERDGTTVRRADLDGRPWVASFVFTRCAAFCPRLTERMKELRERLPAKVRSVSFSVDPEHDRPQVLSEYAARWEITGREWLFLTGSRDEIWRLVREGFLLSVEESPGDTGSPILHSNRFVLVDSSGRIRGTYEAFEPDALERIVADLAQLERERTP